MAVADLIGLPAAELAALATRMAAAGDRRIARLAALMANDGGACPFDDPWLAACWRDRIRIMGGRDADLATWSPRRGGNAAAASVRRDDDEGLDL